MKLNSDGFFDFDGWRFVYFATRFCVCGADCLTRDEVLRRGVFSLSPDAEVELTIYHQDGGTTGEVAAVFCCQQCRQGLEDIDGVLGLWRPPLGLMLVIETEHDENYRIPVFDKSLRPPLVKAKVGA